MPPLPPDDLREIMERLDGMFRQTSQLYDHLGPSSMDMLQADHSDDQGMANTAMQALSEAHKHHQEAARTFMSARPKVGLVTRGGPGSEKLRATLGNELYRLEDELQSAQNFLQGEYLPNVDMLDDDLGETDPGNSDMLHAHEMAQRICTGYTSALGQVKRLRDAFPAPTVELD